MSGDRDFQVLSICMAVIFSVIALCAIVSQYMDEQTKRVAIEHGCIDVKTVKTEGN